MASTRKGNNAKAKANKSRPESTSTLAQPSSSSQLYSLFSAFSPDASHFAVATLAVDKHRLRVYNTSTGVAVAECTVESGQITSLTWGSLSLSKSGLQQDGSSPSKRKKKKVDNVGSVVESLDEVVLLGLSTGSILIFSPSQSKVLRRLSHPSSTSAVISITLDTSKPGFVWSSTLDSSILFWDLDKDTLADNWKNDSRIPYTTISIQPSVKSDKSFFVAAHHEIRFMSVSATRQDAGQKPEQVSSYTGHASSVKSIQWASPSKFLSSAEADRFVYLWDTDTTSKSAGPSASISLDADVRKIHCSTGSSEKPVLATLSGSGKIFLVPIPNPLPKTVDPRQNTSTTPTLLPRATISELSKSTTIDAPVLDLIFAQDQESLLIARWVKGVRPVFETIRYKDENGDFIRNIMLEEVSTDVTQNESQLPVNKRYVEPASVGVVSGVDIDQEDIDEFSAAQRDVDGALQVDLAQLSLGQRLAALTPGGPVPSNSDEDDEGAEVQPRKRTQNKETVVPANSLTRTLIQALHSSDARLLETCLTHSDPTLIRNTVKRLPPQLAVPLIMACVDRLGRGGRGANMKGGGAASSSQRGSGLVTWITTVLTIHTGHLMTIPDLVARLSALHSTLTDRLSLHQSLLSLSGRLDMVLSQIDLRATSSSGQGRSSQRQSKKKNNTTTVRRYTEGDSESEDEGMDIEVEVDNVDDEDSVEDIELGGDSESEEDDSGSEEDLEGDSDEEGFIDDEAEEADTDEEESD